MLNRDSFFSSLSNAAQWEPGCTFNRKNPIPLDSTSVFKSYDDLSAYINKKTDNTAYPGQIVVVINESQSDAYVIEPSGPPTKLAAGGNTDDLSSKIFGKFTDIESSVSNLANKVSSVESDIIAISGNHETRLSTVETTVGKLSSAMHFRGVINDVQEGTEISAALLSAFDDLQDGDIAIHLESGTEYIYSNSAWYQLGDETNHASKSALVAEETTRKSADSELCNLINKKVYVDGHEVSSLSVKNISRDDYHDLVVNETVDPNTIYVVSSETLNMYGEKIENVLSGKNDTDAATVGQVNAAKDEAIAAAKANSISAIELNGVSTTLSNNKFTFDISCINCGDANS